MSRLTETEFLESLKAEFFDTTLPVLDECERLLLQALNEADSGVFPEIRRLLHSVKGSAGAVGLTAINELLHDFESRFDERVRCAAIRDTVQYSLKVLDGLRQYIEKAEEGTEGQQILQALQSALRAA